LQRVKTPRQLTEATNCDYNEFEIELSGCRLKLGRDVESTVREG
jgi:hypothetical protein